jgi:MFS transporter, DHA1 family, inner membrane transport protein
VNRLLVVALFFGGFVANMNLVATGTYLSPMARDLDLPVSLTGQAQTAALVIGAIVGLLVGPMSDHYGIRRMLILGAVSMAICGFATAVATDFWTLALGRIPGGVAFGMIMGLGASVASTQLPQEERRSALGWMVSGAALAVILGAPMLAMLGELFSWRLGFVLVGSLGIALVPGYLRAVSVDPPRPDTPFRPVDAILGYREILSDSRMALLQAATVIWAISWTGVNTYFGAFAIDSVGISLQEFGFLFMWGGIVFMIGSRSAPFFCRFWTPRWVMTPIAGLLCLASVLYFTLPTGFLELAVIMTLIGFAGGNGLPLIMILVAEVMNTRLGSVMMLRQFCYGIGSAFGAVFGGLFLSVGGYPFVGIGLGVFALMTVLMVILVSSVPVSEAQESAAPAD